MSGKRKKFFCGRCKINLTPDQLSFEVIDGVGKALCPKCGGIIGSMEPGNATLRDLRGTY